MYIAHDNLHRPTGAQLLVYLCHTGSVCHRDQSTYHNLNQALTDTLPNKKLNLTSYLRHTK